MASVTVNVPEYDPSADVEGVIVAVVSALFVQRYVNGKSPIGAAVRFNVVPQTTFCPGSYVTVAVGGAKVIPVKLVLEEAEPRSPNVLVSVVPDRAENLVQGGVPVDKYRPAATLLTSPPERSVTRNVPVTTPDIPVPLGRIDQYRFRKYVELALLGCLLFTTDTPTDLPE